MEAYFFGVPWIARLVPAEKLAERFVKHNEFGILDRKDFFVQGCIEIRVIGREFPFYWCVWASLDCTDFARAINSVPHAGGTKAPSYAGFLANRIGIYPNTLGLKLRIHPPEVGRKHTFNFEPADHPLVSEQRQGISLERWREISELLTHEWRHPPPAILGAR
jgi:hypothetical protein